MREKGGGGQGGRSSWFFREWWTVYTLELYSPHTQAGRCGKSCPACTWLVAAKPLLWLLWNSLILFSTLLLAQLCACFALHETPPPFSCPLNTSYLKSHDIIAVVAVFAFLHVQSWVGRGPKRYPTFCGKGMMLLSLKAGHQELQVAAELLLRGQ